MARIRSIKPAITQDRKLAGLSRDARLTFVYLISQADDQGLVPAESRQLLGALYPHDDDVTWRKLSRWIAELVDAKLIAWHQTVDGMAVVRLVGWSKHQMVKNPGKPVLWGQLADPPSDDVPPGLTKPSGKSPPRRPTSSGGSTPSRPRSSVESPEDVVRPSGDSGGAEGEGEGEGDKGRGRGKRERGSPPPDGASETEPKAPPNWPARLSEVWGQHIGTVNPGRLGKALKPFVDRHGEAIVARAIELYGADALDRGEIRFCTPENFARTAAQWVKDATPVGERTFEPGGAP